MSAEMQSVLSYWRQVMADTEAKPADRIKVSEDLAKYLDNRSETPLPPPSIRIDYAGLPADASPEKKVCSPPAPS